MRKTTVAKALSDTYLNWDDAAVRAAVIAGQRETASRLGLDGLDSTRRIVAFDETHKHPRWKSFLKGFLDLFEDRLGIIATGSAKMNVFKRGGDSLMGRYFPTECIRFLSRSFWMCRRPRPVSSVLRGNFQNRNGALF